MKIRILALILGALCHLSFLTSVAIMMFALYGTMRVNALSLSTGTALAIDLLLVIQFPIFHSLMLRPSGRAFLSRLFPGEIGKHLVTTTFVIAASFQLLILFTLWTHIGSFEWRPAQPFLTAWTTFYGASWILLALAMTNAGLATQMGFLGWTAVFRGKAPVYRSFPKHGLYRVCRHPVYFAMALVSVSGPVWNIDHVIIAAIFVTYCVVGPRVKEKRLREHFGADFEAHIREVPFFPTPQSCWRALTTPARTSA